MDDSRGVFISREYTKGKERLVVLVAALTGGDISGVIYQYEEWANNQERTGARMTSGNKYEVRKRFVNRLMDLDEDGWKKMIAASGGSDDQRFFDPSGL